MEHPDAAGKEATNQTITGTTWCLLLGLYILQFLGNLNRAITGTLVPALTDAFGTQDDVGFYISIYNLTGSVAILFFCKLSTIWTAHGVTLTGVICSMTGSIISGAASNSGTFVVGRFVAGLGMAAATTGVMTIVHAVVPERHIPIVIGLFMTASSGATIAGPVIGGAIEQSLSWRWAFYLDPILCVFPGLVLLLTMSKSPKSIGCHDPAQLFWRLDPAGNISIAASTTCLLLFLQFGGSTYDWNDGRMIALIVLSITALAIFVYTQHRFPRVAVVPSRLIKQSEIAWNIGFATLTGGLVVIGSFFLPQWYQLQHGVSAKQAGVSILPLAISTAISGIFAGICVKTLGSYAPLTSISISLATIASGLFTIVTPDTATSVLIGFQILLGTAIGMSLPLPHLAIRKLLKPHDLGTGAAIMIFSQMLGSSILATLAQLVLQNKLQDGLAGHYGIKEGAFDQSGATELLATVSASDLPLVLDVWNLAFVRVFYVLLATSAVGVVVSVAILWKSRQWDGARVVADEAACIVRVHNDRR